ncbi:MAG: metallophosphoesterase, partial [Rhizobiaceae bacterium]
MGDLHVKEHGSESYKDLFAEISQEADILVLTGDLTDLGKVKEAELLAADLRSCSIPMVAVLGNHDYECGCVEEVTHILKDAGVHLL